MFSSFIPPGTDTAAAAITVTRCDSNTMNEKTNNDHQIRSAERFSRFFDGLVSFTRLWGILTAIGECNFIV